MNQSTRMGTLGEASDRYVTALHRGWVDKQNGQLWAGYETATQEEQLAYEAGRLFLANVKLAKVCVPVWRGTRAEADRFGMAVAMADRRVGGAVPIAARTSA